MDSLQFLKFGQAGGWQGGGGGSAVQIWLECIKGGFQLANHRAQSRRLAVIMQGGIDLNAQRFGQIGERPFLQGFADVKLHPVGQFAFQPAHPLRAACPHLLRPGGIVRRQGFQFVRQPSQGLMRFDRQSTIG